MHLQSFTTPVRRLTFRTWRALTVRLPGGPIRAFGSGAGQIQSIIVINLDRQPNRWRAVSSELNRFRTSQGHRLTTITRRLAAVDARDGRAVAATVDVDAMYRIADQLHVQPDARLAECFPADQTIRMTRQEVAVARSHVEAWKSIANGAHEYVLVLEDDVWFKPRAAQDIHRGWRAAMARSRGSEGPGLFYLSYSDAGGTAAREEPCRHVFRPARGLWFLSGYVLSRSGAASLLRAMPVVGPVDLWMNYRFAELGVLALMKPAIAQRSDAASSNSYSILPYLARAGIVDVADLDPPPDMSHIGPVLAWTDEASGRECVAMALSMLGLRVLAFDGDEEPMRGSDLLSALQIFDVVVNAPLCPDAVASAMWEGSVVFVEPGARVPAGLEVDGLPIRATLPVGFSCDGSWAPLCSALGLDVPADAFPSGPSRALRMFRRESQVAQRFDRTSGRFNSPTLDQSPWVLPPTVDWRPALSATRMSRSAGNTVLQDAMKRASANFPWVVGTFPGNLAAFTEEGCVHSEVGVRLVLDVSETRPRPFRSGAFASVASFGHGRFEAEIRAARGQGLVTGFFLHRDTPRQEIDIELLGADPRHILVNVFFNPGDDGTSMSYGYRGSPCLIDLGFDATADFHHYGIDWQPDRIGWTVDGRVVHERWGWDPTPIPHLNMRLHGNLWAPRSEALAGRIEQSTMPVSAIFRNLSVEL